MVLKLAKPIAHDMKPFENDVKTYGTQTLFFISIISLTFENDVKTYGTQTVTEATIRSLKFENDVKTYGTQTLLSIQINHQRLRMM